MDFEAVYLLGNDERTVLMETRRNRRIENTVAPECGVRGERAYQLKREKHGPHWENRKPACGVYNCFGLVFASRRTAIYEESEIEKILSDDSYRPVERKKDVVTGDVVLYRIAGEYQHAARVTRVEIVNGLANVYALSKWDDHCGEDQHEVGQHCWKDPTLAVRIEFWTDRP